jgi:hypothetical protein
MLAAAGVAGYGSYKIAEKYGISKTTQQARYEAAAFGAGSPLGSAEENKIRWDAAKDDLRGDDGKRDLMVGGQGKMGLLGIGEGGANPFANVHAKAEKGKSPTEHLAALAKTVADLNTPFSTLTQRVTDMATAAQKASAALGTIQGGNGGGVIPSPGGGESLSHGNLGAPGASS